MNKVAIIFAFLTLATVASGQRIISREKDEFTDRTVTTTSWEVACRNVRTGNTYFRVIEIDGIFFLDAKIDVGGKVLAIHNEGELIFLFSDGERLTLNSLSSYLGSRGAGAVGLSGSNSMGIQARYGFAKENDYKILQTKTVSRYRVYFTDGYTDFEPNRSQSSNIQNLFKLF